MKTRLLIFWLHVLDHLLAIPTALFWRAAEGRSRVNTQLENLKANTRDEHP